MGSLYNVCIFACFLMLIMSIAEAKDLSLIVFGDSYVRSNETLFGNTAYRSDFYPYGKRFIDFPMPFTDPITMGRFTDLYTLPESMNLLNYQFYNSGYNYASGCTGILPETGTIFGETVTMTNQILTFKTHIRTNLTKECKTKEKLRHFLANSIYVIHVGSHDYIDNYLWDDNYKKQNQQNPNQFAKHLIAKLETHLNALYELGARKMLVFEIPPLGCLPRIINQMKVKDGCSEKINNMASIFNKKLEQKLKQLNVTMSGSVLAIGKQNDFILDMVKKPSKYGLSNTRKPCCVVRKDGSGLCEKDNLHMKEIEQESLFFDSVHFSFTSIDTMSQSCFNSTDLCVPNILALANLNL